MGITALTRYLSPLGVTKSQLVMVCPVGMVQEREAGERKATSRGMRTIYLFFFKKKNLHFLWGNQFVFLTNVLDWPKRP